MPKRKNDAVVDTDASDGWSQIARSDDVSAATEWLDKRGMVSPLTLPPWLLQVCAREGAPNLIGLLVSRGAKVDSRDPESQRMTPLMVAAEGRQSQHLRCVKCLLELGADPNLKDSTSCLALAHALKGADKERDPGRLTIVEETVAALLAAGADASAPGASPAVFIALSLESPSILRRLLDAGASVHGLPQVRKTTARHAREMGMREEDVAGAVRGEKLVPPLEVAVHANRTASVRLLLERGATPDPAFHFDKRSPLLVAVEQNQIDILKLLITHGADINSPQLPKQWSPLLWGCFKGASLETVKLLLDSGARVDFAADGWTPLSMAWATRRNDLVDLFLSRGARAPGMIGVMLPQPEKIGAELERIGVRFGMPVIDVKVGSAADVGGILPDDVFIELAGRSVDSAETFFAIAGSLAAGDTVEAVIVRTSVRVNLELKLGPPMMSTLKFGRFPG